METDKNEEEEKKKKKGKICSFFKVTIGCVCVPGVWVY